ncbi:MAG: serine hydrolase [Acidobacteria bacterium]|nr:serine hydrolase [Acidobacteriota bacterium]
MRPTPRRATTLLAATLAALLVAAPAASRPLLAATPDAEAAVTIAGHWNGAIKTPGPPLAVNIDFRRGDDGGFTGDITIPVQGAQDLPLANIRVNGSDVTFDLPGIPGEPRFKGKLADDGATISGDFTQGGQTIPFSISRGDDRAAQAKTALEGFDAFVEKEMKDFKVPGLAMVVLVDGKPVLSKGFGLRDVKNNLPVTTGTLFAIGSSTKAFTTFVLGTLVDEGKMEWDKPLSTYIPDFRMSDRVATERLTPRDLVTHRSGLPRHDLVWYNSKMSRKEMVARLAYLEPYRDLRQEFHYQNLMFLTAGYLAEQLTGGSWEAAVRSRILEPAGMSHTNFSVLDSQKTDDFAKPYREIDDRVDEIPFRTIDNVGPAGAINSTVEDMALWLKVQLGGGKAGERPLINKTTLVDMHTAHMAMSIPPDRAELPQISYGMGWFVQPYRGHNRIHHGGNIDGFSAQVSFLPQDQIGMVVLTNKDGTPLPELIMRHALDRLLDLPRIDWAGETLVKLSKAKDAGEEAKKNKNLVRKQGTKPAHPLDEYAGEYENPGYGRLRISRAGDHLEATYNDIAQPLEHWHYEVWNGTQGAKDPVFEDMKFLFVTNMKGEVDAVQAPFEPETKDIVFTKLADARMSDPGYLKQFVGEYDLAGQTVAIALKGSVLTMTVPGQPQYELAPDRLNEFNLKNLSVISVKFTIEAREGVTEMVVSQPEGVFVAKRKK